MKAVGTPDNVRHDVRDSRRELLLHMLITLGVMGLLSLIVYFFNIPNPNIILMTGLTFFTTLYGFGAGAISSVVMIGYSMFFFSDNHNWITFSPLNLQKMSVIVLGAIACTLLIGNLKRQYTNANHRLAEINRYLRDDNQSLEEASLTDALTGVRNRFGLRRDYNQFESRYVHVMMMDLDNFKRSNDTYGHAVGDFILRKVGRLLSECFGANSCYRYGGDEFLIICIDMDRDVFPDKLNTLKQGLNGIHLNDKHLPAHFSAGYVYGDCELSYDLRLMIHQADGNLYRAKQQGRDCYVGEAYSREKAESIEYSAKSRERGVMNFSDLFPV